MLLRKHVPQLARIYDETVRLAAVNSGIRLQGASAAPPPRAEPAAVRAEEDRVATAVRVLGQVTAPKGPAVSAMAGDAVSRWSSR